MMPPHDRELALEQMDQAIKRFYASAVRISNHPFVEFAGVMQAYLDACRRAHAAGVDFTECNRHSGNQLPMHAFEVDYLNEKLDCIFAGRIMARVDTRSDRSAAPDASYTGANPSWNRPGTGSS